MTFRGLFLTVFFVCSALVFFGCEGGGDDDDSSSSSSADSASSDASSDASADNSAESFTDIRPTGLVLTDKVVDRNSNITTLFVACDPVEGAVTYRFYIACNGHSQVNFANTPNTSFEVSVEDGQKACDLHVYAINDAGEETHNAAAWVNQ